MKMFPISSESSPTGRQRRREPACVLFEGTDAKQLGVIGCRSDPLVMQSLTWFPLVDRPSGPINLRNTDAKQDNEDPRNPG
jgi:hypothetical protein